MTVEELWEKLQRLPNNMEVKLKASCCPFFHPIESKDCETEHDSDSEKEVFVIRAE